ncbi:telomeric repeat-binding factor 1 isoform 1-T1 [Pholidichthys leucotaenia]
MFDFMFVSLCRRFKEGKLKEFNEALQPFQAISLSPSVKGELYKEKEMICAFLARVMHGEQLDALFEDDDDSVMPLMSAVKIWTTLEHTVADECLFETITNLLIVQSVAVCLEKGQRTSASSALRWFENNINLPRNLRVQLSKIVAQGDTYHRFLKSFSFNHLLEMVQSFVAAYLEKNPSDYLLKAATEVLQSSHNIENLDDVSPDSPVSQTTNESTKTKRKLLSTNMADLWKPESSKKPFISVRRLSSNELSQWRSKKPRSTTVIQKTRTKRKWTFLLDKYLKEGVKRHGEGNWAHILLDYDFEGRTSTMLKDRWRVLKRNYKV